MKRFTTLTCLAVVLAIMPAVARGAGFDASGSPNLLVILCDDVGWGEFGFQGSADIPTPNIDSIATCGVRFSNGYAAGTYCSPSRAGFLTGRYPTRFGHEFNSVVQNGGLSLSEITIAQRLQALGYVTCAVGKWHLGARQPYRPVQRGFDEFYGTAGNSSHYHPLGFVDSRVSPNPQVVTEPGFYTTEAYGQRAVEWIEDHQDQPWFLYLSFDAAHDPLEAPQEYVDRFSHITDAKRRMFAAMMSAMDDAVGRVLDTIHELGQEEDTLIVFTSDNGGPTQQTTASNLPLRGGKATTWEGGIRIPFCMQWKGILPEGVTYQQPVIHLDLYPTLMAAAGGNIDPRWKLDGVNLLPYLTGQVSGRPHNTLYWRFGMQAAIRHGNWKLVVSEGSGKRPQLFNLTNDLSESRDMAAQLPSKARELRGLWEKWSAQQARPSAPPEWSLRLTELWQSYGLE